MEIFMPETPRQPAKKTRPLARSIDEANEPETAYEFRSGSSSRPANTGRVRQASGYVVGEIETPPSFKPNNDAPTITVTKISTSGAIVSFELAESKKLSKSKKRRMRAKRAKLKRMGLLEWVLAGCRYP
jgi:hypothetical protein